MMTKFFNDFLLLVYLFLYLLIRIMDSPISFARWTLMSRKGPLIFKSSVLNY